MKIVSKNTYQFIRNLLKVLPIYLLSISLYGQNDSVIVEDLYTLGNKKQYSDIQDSKVNFEKAVQLIDSIILLKKTESPYYLLKKALILDRLSYIYRKEIDYELSLKAVLKSIEIKNNIEDTYTLSESYLIRGKLYYRRNDTIKTLENYNKALLLAEKNKNSKSSIDILNAYSAYFIKKKQLIKGEEFGNKALKYADSIDYKLGKLLAYSNLSSFESKNKNYKKSILYVNDELKLSKEINNLIGVERSNKKLGYYYRKLKQPRKAVLYYTKSLELIKDIGITSSLANRYLALSNVYTDLKQHELAFSYYRLYKRQQIRDLNIKKIKEFTELELTYKFNKEKQRDSLQFAKEREVALAKNKMLRAESKVKSQWMLFGGIGLLALFTIIYLIRSQKFIRTKQVLQQQFSQDLINGQEKERSRLARELHDSVGQKLMLLSRQTKNSGDSNMGDLADTTLEEIRNISRGLHPSNLERLGLTEAINALVYDINANTELFFTEEIENIDNTLSKESELHLFRIIQETLSNIVKHADAKAVKMKVNKTGNSINISVSDNGKGFNINAKKKNLSLGLKTLFERAKIMKAKINLISNKGKGTVMSLNVPL